jgi:RNA polymerase sigma-70 factor (ECF subfamily)
MTSNDNQVQNEPAASNAAGTFATTHWTMVLMAGNDSTAAREALETLCRTYWVPVYTLARARGADAESARDVTQNFFARLLSRDGLAKAQRERGRFRSFLAQSLKNFMSDEWRKTQALKRGGGENILSLDFAAAEGRYQEPHHDNSPDREFDRRWAEQILAEARRRFEREYVDSGRGEMIQVLDRLGDPGAPSLSEEAARLDIMLNTLKSHLHRARLRHARIIRDLVAETVPTPADVEEELRQLLAVLSG